MRLRPLRPCRRERHRGGRTSLTGAPGTLYVGTSGFAYPGWSPRFYPPGLADGDRLPFYASRFPAVELNNTFYARPTVEKIRTWVAATPPDFRFVIKAQRGAASRGLTSTPEESVAWLTERLGAFGDRLGGVLLSVPENVHRRDDGSSDTTLGRLLAAWPRVTPLVMEFPHPSWHVDETFAALRASGAMLSATEHPEDDAPPTLRLTGSSLYLRLRRHEYAEAQIAGWAERIRPFLEAGHGVYVFFRHDDTGRATELADALRARVSTG